MIDLLAPSDARLTRALVYRFLAALYLTEPDVAWLARLARDGLLDEFPAPVTPGPIQEGLSHLRTSSHRLAGDDGESEAATIRRDYDALFAGPGHVPAPPWESVYRSDERLLFDWPTLEVRAAYRAMGLRSDRPRDADDHVGLELLFLALMDERAADGDEQAVAARQRFLDEHVRQWVPSLCHDMHAAATTDFWRGVALLTTGILSQEQER